jgi:hypothetical protein
MKAPEKKNGSYEIWEEPFIVILSVVALITLLVIGVIKVVK